MTRRFEWCGKRLLLACITLMTVVILGLANAKPVFAAPVITRISVSNVRETTFTVSWMTDVASTGTVNYGTTTALGSTGNDVRGAGTSSTTHFVTISGLLTPPGTQYYFDVVSGTTVANNGGSHFTVTTGSTPTSPPSSDVAYGQVFKVDHTTFAAGTIVFINIVDGNSSGSSGSSATMSTLVDGTGYWSYNLGSARTTDLSNYFSYSPAGGDNLQLFALGGTDGTAQSLANTSSDTPVVSLYLDGQVPTAVILSSFTVNSQNPSSDTMLGVLAMGGSIILLSGMWLIRARG